MRLLQIKTGGRRWPAVTEKSANPTAGDDTVGTSDAVDAVDGVGGRGDGEKSVARKIYRDPHCHTCRNSGNEDRAYQARRIVDTADATIGRVCDKNVPGPVYCDTNRRIQL